MTIIGVLSDSHGRAEITARAVAAVRDAGATILLHLGDLGTEAVIDELIGYDAHIVLGNCDLDERSLSSYAGHMGVAVDHPMGRLTVQGRTIAFTHGHLGNCMDAALADGVDYLLHGHTHEVRDERVGKTRIINPGALHRARRYTAAVLDPAADQLTFIEVPRDG